MPITKRPGTAVWNGGLTDGKGTLSTRSGALNSLPYSFVSRFKNDEGTLGTNPEELLAASHAGCFTMALSMILGKLGLTPEELKTTATVLLENDPEKLGIAGVELTVEGKVPGATAQQFSEAAETAKANCLISKVLNVPVTLSVKFE